MKTFRHSRSVLAGASLGLVLLAPLAAAPAAQAAGSAPAAVAVQPQNLAAPVTGTWTDPATGRAGTFSGTFTPTRFAPDGDRLGSTGRLAGTFADAQGAPVQTVDQQVTLPVQTLAASCDVLNLVLGPLDLNLLGLRVQLNQVHLDVSAVPGAGNLLGNLLCGVAGLLDGVGTLAQISALLNQILALLGGLGV